MSDRDILTVDSLSVSFPRNGGRVRILDRVSYSIGQGEVVGLVGESGSGKTLSSLTVTGFLPRSARIEGGAVRFGGRDLLSLPPDEMASVRGQGIAMIFQSARSALNPLMRVGDQVARAVALQRRPNLSPLPPSPKKGGGSHPPPFLGEGGRGERFGRRDAHAEAIALLSRVGIADAEKRARAYPHQLSGGMCQRILVAMMLACRPSLLIADEPTTGLDVTIQAQIFELIRDVQRDTGASILLITHDLGVVAETCRRVIVMYAGQIMESAPVDRLFAAPWHPYSQLLLSSVLRVDRKVTPPEGLTTLREEVTYGIRGCRFASRCPLVLPECWEERPEPLEIAPGHEVICHRVQTPLPWEERNRRSNRLSPPTGEGSGTGDV